MIESITNYKVPTGVKIIPEFNPDFAEIITVEALQFLKNLHIKFNAERKLLLDRRTKRQAQFDQGTLPEFLPETSAVRMAQWKVNNVLEDLQDRRVEITGPVDRKMIINALNSGASAFMADCEDSNSPTWTNCIEGQINLRDAVSGDISFIHPSTGKEYTLTGKGTTLLVRPRGWHLTEKNILVDGEPMSASLVDFGLYFFHNAERLIENGSGPYFYLPKLESHLEAGLWNDIFLYAQEFIGLPSGTIKATVLIETITAAFELHEILFELKEHSAGLNCGRWDYIFSFIKKLHAHGYVLPDRSEVTMTTPFMKAYSDLVIQVCHQRGAHAMGGMAAQIPIKNDVDANNIAMDKVKKDKLREVLAGHDGTWVAHPGLIPIVKEIFDEHMPKKNQLDKPDDNHKITAEDLLAVPSGAVTENGVRTNINVGILYLERWLSGDGAAALYHLMEDAATAEISRTQLWQWIKSKTPMENGEVLTVELYEAFKKEELVKIKEYVGTSYFEHGRFWEAETLFDGLIKSEELAEFLTLEAYKQLE